MSQQRGEIVFHVVIFLVGVITERTCWKGSENPQLLPVLPDFDFSLNQSVLQTFFLYNSLISSSLIFGLE